MKKLILTLALSAFALSVVADDAANKGTCPASKDKAVCPAGKPTDQAGCDKAANKDNACDQSAAGCCKDKTPVGDKAKADGCCKGKKPADTAKN